MTFWKQNSWKDGRQQNINRQVGEKNRSFPNEIASEKIVVLLNFFEWIKSEINWKLLFSFVLLFRSDSKLSFVAVVDWFRYCSARIRFFGRRNRHSKSLINESTDLIIGFKLLGASAAAIFISATSFPIAPSLALSPSLSLSIKYRMRR